MKILAITLSAFAFLIITPATGSAFSIPADTASVNDSSDVPEFDFSVEYGTTRLYRGIKSSANPYIMPSFVYASPGGFYTGIAGYVPLDSGGFDETDLSAGYEFSISRHTTASIELIHFFFNNNKLANSLIKNEMELYLCHDFGRALKSKLYLDFDFGKESTDRSVTFDNSHEFVLTDAEDSRVTMTPAFSITAGSLNLVKKVKKEVLNSGFGLTNYDLSLSAGYEIGAFIIDATGAYDFPVEKKLPVLQKAIKSDPTFYFTASITYVIG